MATLLAARAIGPTFRELGSPRGAEMTEDKGNGRSPISVIGFDAGNSSESKLSKCSEEKHPDKNSRGPKRSVLSLLRKCVAMGCCDCSDEGPSSKVRPVSPQSPHYESSMEEPIFKKHRSCTDFFALIILIGLICGFGIFLSVAYKKGDIYRVLNGYDDCGNVCGRKTPKEEDPRFCKGADMTSQPYLYAGIGPTGVKSRQCVANCTSEEHIKFLNRCIPLSRTKELTDTANSLIKKLGLQSFFYEASKDLTIVWREIIYLFLIALAISLVLLIAFRFVVNIIIYIVLISVVVVSIAGSTYLWLLWYNEKKDVENGLIHEDDASVQSYLIYAIIMSIATLIIVLIVLVMRKRIALVIQLFKEAGKAVCAMPALLLQPLYTYLFVGATFVAFAYFMLWIESAGDIYVNRKNHTHYKKDTILHVARWYNIFLYFVMVEFYLGCQHMVVAGAVARWYFTRDKSRLSLVITRSTCNVVKYHLGSVALGAMIIGIVRLIRAFLATIQKYLKNVDNPVAKAFLWCCQCCLACFESTLRYLGRNAWIETAIYGCNFCTGGKKAFQALSNNILRVAAINSVGDFVLFLGKVLVVALTVIAGIFLMQKKTGVQHPWLPILLGAIFAFIVAHCFISVYEMIIDTIFICFCEDCNKNDGISRPYYMSKGLMEFVNNSKKALKHLEYRQRAQVQNQVEIPTSFQQSYPPNQSYPPQPMGR